ncbi:hypothetical protein [Natranaeroarchaeum aerophilus]|uniref:Uncharacterized protein n=1 Tax=Natranaeroarchaeum aerophilus TaxID=2917711 RepID=A0AAE3FRQ6_9EURY|nr:hypothetical protein [Natranaeroarchaeum aerophilus]MCL9814119.1 hypothetical protein [Natranaeroarchaeum aerophilus]
MESEQIARKLTGAVAGGLGVTPDYERGRVPCALCRAEGDAALAAGDRVTAALRNYEGHTWEPVAVYCRSHGIDQVTDVMEVLAEEQVILAATLEPTGYLDPLSGYHPNALSFGGVELLDYSPTAAGY